MNRAVWRDVEIKEHGQRAMQAILSDEDAKKSYSNLQAKGLKDTELFQELLGMAGVLAVRPKGKAPKWSKWYSGSGKNDKTLGYFPAQLKGLADDIERINTHPLLRPDKESSFCEPDNKPFVAEFMELPTMLRHYAAHVDALSKHMRRLFRRNKKGSMGSMGQILDCLRWLVQKETGAESPADLSRILVAAVKDVPGSDPKIDFEAELKNRAYRERKAYRQRK